MNILQKPVWAVSSGETIGFVSSWSCDWLIVRIFLARNSESDEAKTQLFFC